MSSRKILTFLSKTIKESAGGSIFSRTTAFEGNGGGPFSRLVFFLCDLLDRFKSCFPISNLPRSRRINDSLKPFAVRGDIGHPVSASPSLLFFRHLEPAQRLRKIFFLPRRDAQRIMASDEHLVSPFGKWKLCGIVGGGEKLFLRALLVTVIGQEQAAPEINIRQREYSLVSNPLLVSIVREPSQMMFKFLFDGTALLPLLPF